MKCEYWYSGHLMGEVRGSMVADQEPINTSFCALVTDKYGATQYALSEYGDIVRTGIAPNIKQVTDVVTGLYRESIRTNVPLVVAMEKPTKGFSFEMLALYSELRSVIKKAKSKRANRQVIIPRLLILPERGSSYGLFGERDRSDSFYREAAEKLVGVSLEGMPIGRVRSICIAYGLSRSTIGERVSPQLSKGVQYV